VVSKDKVYKVNYCSRMAAITENLDAKWVLLWSHFRNTWIRQCKFRLFSELQCVMVCQHLWYSWCWRTGVWRSTEDIS